MSDEPRHPVVQAMIDVIEEVLEPEKFAARKAMQVQINPPKQVELILDPETMLILQLIKMGIDPEQLLPSEKKDDDGVSRKVRGSKARATRKK